jgi:hypothetical protein
MLRIFMTAVMLCLLQTDVTRAQESTLSDNDPTRPVFFSLRPEFYSVDAEVWRMQVVVRYDAAIVRQPHWYSGKRGLLLRFEVPLVAAAAPPIDTQAGLGDTYGQVLVVPDISKGFALVAGTGLSVPTATDTALGTGKWTLAPAVIPVWFLPNRGMFYVKVQTFTSVAGADAHPDLNFLLITPTLIKTLGRRSWIVVDSETKTDWENGGRTGVKSGLQLGWVLPNRVGIWIKPEVWWGPNRSGRWNLKTGIVWYRRGS